MTVYEIVKGICKDRRISIRQVEIKAGLGNGTIGGWRKYRPRADGLISVAKVLEVPVDVLLKGVRV